MSRFGTWLLLTICGCFHVHRASVNAVKFPRRDRVPVDVYKAGYNVGSPLALGQCIQTLGSTGQRQNCGGIPKAEGEVKFVSSSLHKAKMSRVEKTMEYESVVEGGVGVGISMCGLFSASVSGKVRKELKTKSRSITMMAILDTNFGHDSLTKMRYQNGANIPEQHKTNYFVSDIEYGSRDILKATMHFSSRSSKTLVEVTVKVKILFVSFSATIRKVTKSQSSDFKLEVSHINNRGLREFTKIYEKNDMEAGLQKLEELEKKFEDLPLEVKKIFDNPATRPQLAMNYFVLPYSVLKAMPEAKAKVKVLRPEEGSQPKIRISNAKAMAIREKHRGSSMGAFLSRAPGCALQDPVPKPRLDNRGAANREANRTSVVAQVLNPSGSTYHEPAVVPRGSGPQTEANRAKGIGRLRLFGSEGPSANPEPAAPNRCPAGSAAENMNRSRGGSMATVIVHSRDYTEPPPGFRGQGAASQNYERAKGSVMAATMDHSSGGVREAPPARRCPTAAAQEAADKNRGCIDRLISGQLPGDACPKQRLGIGAGSNAQREGDGMMRTLAGGGQREPPPAARVTSAGAANAAKNSGCLTQMQYKSREAPAPEEARGRTRPGPAASNAQSSQGTATRMLFAKYGKLPADPKAQNRVQPRGRKIARLSSGSQTRDLLNPPKPRRHRRPKSCHN